MNDYLERDPGLHTHIRLQYKHDATMCLLALSLATHIHAIWLYPLRLNRNKSCVWDSGDATIGGFALYCFIYLPVGK